MDPKFRRALLREERPKGRRILLLCTTLMSVLALAVYWPALQARIYPPGAAASGPSPTAPTATSSATPSPSPSPTLTPTPTPALSLSETPSLSAPFGSPGTTQGLVILAASESGHSHLFAYSPGALPLTRLTNGGWNDLTPALSPDGSRLAFSSNRSGPYDLYLLDLTNGELRRLTDTPQYEAAPSFSPDGRWLAYEALSEADGGGLEIFIMALDGSQAPIRLTEDPAADFSPAWSPKGRQVAFVSDRSGEDEIWIADLDKVEGRFQNLSRSNQSIESHPAWSPDGERLAWAASGEDGVQSLVVWDGGAARQIGSGAWPTWSPDGTALLSGLAAPNQTYLTGYNLNQRGLALPPIPLNGGLRGLTWSRSELPLERLVHLTPEIEQAASATQPALWQAALKPLADIPNGRQRLVPLEDVEAPTAMLQDMVDEAFQALRARTAQEAGWDFLSSLENAFVALTSPLPPGMGSDWLYTGRAFAFNPLPANAGWLVVRREDFGSQTYWRVYLRARFQDGSLGAPLHSPTWDFNARTSGDPRAYEQGGRLQERVPPGYWIDFTELALAYGFERLPALNTWRSAVATTRFNEFVLRGGQDWRDAMLELYPPEALVTPTVVVPTTAVPSATLRPTRTPFPTRTPWPSRTPTPTRTPRSSPTPAS